MKMKSTGKQVLVKSSGKKRKLQAAELLQEISKRAYLNFENSGRVNGNDLVHWYAAETEVIGENK
ncbi:MAG: hypothetical protein A2231_07940 [Candidatus Firestonebacteria bacterium RIFOXYA2_FULL_40_8]|nr:MAG: hypothetical protein A2231_07940 [Candidatus Firestonebacteria bacterium RIFOXYA2_FULL_40_8]